MEAGTFNKMVEVLKNAKAGDRLELVFANKTFDGDLSGRIFMLLALNGTQFLMQQFELHNLQAVAESGKWHDFRTFNIVVTREYEPDYFIARTLGRGLLESVRVVPVG